jgi:hypothetical protein
LASLVGASLASAVLSPGRASPASDDGEGVAADLVSAGSDDGEGGPAGLVSVGSDDRGGLGSGLVSGGGGVFGVSLDAAVSADWPLSVDGVLAVALPAVVPGAAGSGMDVGVLVGGAGSFGSVIERVLLTTHARRVRVLSPRSYA